MSSRYLNIKKTFSQEKKQIYIQTYYPSIGFKDDDLYIITSNTDRLDLIAFDFWGDDKLWWVLAMVNNLECDSMFPPNGTQLRIPKDVESIINLYNENNI